MEEQNNAYLRGLTQEKYKYGFTTDIHTDIIEKGLNEDVIRLISAKKNEPEWLLEFRLKAYRYWLTMELPTWAHLNIPEIDFQDISYYADPTKKKEGPKSMEPSVRPSPSRAAKQHIDSDCIRIATTKISVARAVSLLPFLRCVLLVLNICIFLAFSFSTVIR